MVYFSLSKDRALRPFRKQFVRSDAERVLGGKKSDSGGDGEAIFDVEVEAP